MRRVLSPVLPELVEGLDGCKNLVHSYSDGVHNKTIAILGNYPPPLGGVSVHIQRVMHKFQQQGNTVHHFDTSKRTNLMAYVLRLCFFLCKTRFNLVYYHTVDLNSRLIEFKMLIMLKKLLKIRLIVVEHNCRHLYTRTASYKKNFSLLMQDVDHLVLIGHATYTSYQDNRIPLPLHTIEAAFLPPDQSAENAIVATYDPELLQFIASHNFIITVNAFQLTLLAGNDLYGIDQCIQLVYRLKADFQLIGLIVVLGQVGDAQHYAHLTSFIKNYNLEQNVVFVLGQKELWPLLKRSDIFVRPTLSDAESISVQEALYFNVPVIASDACIRPAGVVTFKTGNVEDFYAKINNHRNHMHAQQSR